jgi:nicotinamide-nucleotide adenylyltransferase
MVRDALKAQGLDSESFSVVPLPISFPELYKYYVPLEATFFLTIYDDWGRKKLERFRSLGLQVDVLWERPLAKKGISGNDVRLRMARGNDWDALVPESTRQLIERWGVPARLRKLHKVQRQSIACAQ